MKTILSAIFTVALVSVLVGAGTFAYYTDTETSSENTFTTGTMDLYMKDGDTNINAEWVMENMIPGSSSESGDLNLWNIGTLEADHVEISFSTVCTDLAYEAGDNEESDTLNGASGMDKYLEVVYMSYVDADGIETKFVDKYDSLNPWNTDYIDDDPNDGNDYIDLADLNGVTFDGLTAPPIDGDINDDTDSCEFIFLVRFHEDAPNDYQGDECELIATFTLNQDASQTETV